MWVGLIQSAEDLNRKKGWPLRKEEFCHQTAFSLEFQHQLPWASCLLADPANFGLASLHNRVNQFFKIYPSPPLSLNIHILSNFVYLENPD